MYNSEHCDVELICDNSVMDSIIDRFGQDIETIINDETSFRITVNVATSHVFYSWVFGFEGLVKINAPIEVKEKSNTMPKALFKHSIISAKLGSKEIYLAYSLI